MEFKKPWIPWFSCIIVQVITMMDDLQKLKFYLVEKWNLKQRASFIQNEDANSGYWGRHKFLQNFLECHRYKRILFFCWVVIFLGLIACQEKPHYQDAFQERVLLQLLLKPVPDPLASCGEYFRSQSECLTKSIGLRFIPTPETLAAINFEGLTGSPPQIMDIVSLCNGILNSGFYSRFTVRTQGCYFGCKSDIWRGKNMRNECGTRVSQLYSVESESRRSTECIRNCTQVNNTESFP